MNKPRLIDANELIQSRPENLNEKYTTELIAAHHKGWNECNKAWLKIIEAQPTAYDIQGVVEHMELIIELADKDLCVPGRNCHGNCQEHYLEAMVEIAKGGAVDDETMA